MDARGLPDDWIPTSPMLPRHNWSPNYLDGYKTGLTWNAPWIPGGPAVFDAKTLNENHEWLLGWQHGRNDDSTRKPEVH